MLHTWNYSPDYFRRSEERLEESLGKVAAYKPWRGYDPGAGHHIDDRYRAMPVFTKADIRRNFPGGMAPADRDVNTALVNGTLGLARTSGSSDIAVTNIWNQEWWDASERASWDYNSHASRLATGSHHEAILVNPRNVGRVSDKLDLPMEERRLARFLFLNEKTDPTRWTPQLMDRMLDELKAFQPVVLEANPSYLARLCRYAYRSGREVFQPGLIVFTYEYPAGFHLRQIRRVFDSPFTSSYGSTETGYVFMQCEAGKWHQNTAFCRTDVQSFRREHGGPDVGRLLVTTFGNPWYHIVHYDVGDLVRVDSEGACSCGRNSGMVLSAIEGRALSVTLACSGRLVTLREVDDALTVLEEIDDYRLVQTAPGSYDLLLVSRAGEKSSLSSRAGEVLKTVYGAEAQVQVTFAGDIPPESSGKYVLARASFPVDLERYLENGMVHDMYGEGER